MTAVVTTVLVVATGIISMWEVTTAATVSAKDALMVEESTLLLGMSHGATSGGAIPSAAVVSTKASPIAVLRQVAQQSVAFRHGT